MALKMIVRSIRVDPVLDRRIASYAQSAGLKESVAVRDLLEKGLACESLSVFATPVGKLIRDVIEAEFGLLRSDFEEHQARMEERLAKVCSRGTKASLHAAMQLNDLSRSLVPAWREVPAKELWDSYSRAGGELQHGIPYIEVKAGMR